jgi:GcrA cell cycle regulator
MSDFAVYPSETDPPAPLPAKSHADPRLGNASAMKWQPEHDAALIRLRSAGFSSAKAAAALNGEFGTSYSRNAVIGRVFRLQLTFPGQKRPAKVVKIRTPRIQTRCTPVKAKLSPIDFEAVPDVPVDICPNRVLLLFADESHCRWPAADDGSADMVCGDPKVEGRSWCARHARVAFRAPETRRRAA